MKKIKKQKLGSYLLILVVLLVVAVLIPLYRNSNFNKPIPDVVELPEDIKLSIQNTKPQRSFKVPILLYHYVEYVKDPGDTIRKSLNIVPATFDLEVKTLKDAGYTFITLSDLADALDNRRDLPENPVILTFDDGYRDFYTDVFPILKRYQVKAVTFVVPNFLDKPNNLTSWQMKEIINSGLVEIGAHTMDHSYLTSLPLNKMKYEIEESKKSIEKNFNISVVSFAYPGGAFNNNVIDVVNKAGFRTAVTTIPGIFAQDLNKLFLYRIRPGGRVGQSLLNLLKSESLKIGNYPPQTE